MIRIKRSYVRFCLYLFFSIKFTWAFHNFHEIDLSHRYLNLFSSVALYDEASKEINVYGNSHYEIDYIKMDDELDFEFIQRRTVNPLSTNPTFLFRILVKQDLQKWLNPMINLLQFHYYDHEIDNQMNITKIQLVFPFEEPTIKAKLNSLDPNSTTITTITNLDIDYVRIEEWIDYNLKLDFEAIIIFDNSSPILPNQQLSRDVKLRSFKERIAQKYGHRGVFIIDFPYLSMQNHHWNQLQFFTMTIGVDVLRSKCKYIATIDIDEFIYLPENCNQKISDFLMQYEGTHVTMSSRVITNKNSNDTLNNDVLKLAVYVREKSMYPKMILYTPKINEHEWILTPHNHNHVDSVYAANDTIIHYHAWMNKRLTYEPSMVTIDFLHEFLYNE